MKMIDFTSMCVGQDKVHMPYHVHALENFACVSKCRIVSTRFKSVISNELTLSRLPCKVKPLVVTKTYFLQSSWWHGFFCYLRMY